MNKRIHLRIDAKHAEQLMAGQRIRIKVPPEASEIELSFGFRVPTPGKIDNSFAKLCDVFFNKRPA